MRSSVYDSSLSLLRVILVAVAIQVLLRVYHCWLCTLSLPGSMLIACTTTIFYLVYGCRMRGARWGIVTLMSYCLLSNPENVKPTPQAVKK